MTLASVVLGASLPVLLTAQGGPRPGVDPGPCDNDVLLYRAWPDGTSERVAVFERSGVPTPGVVENADGSRLFLVTGPPRAGTPSAGRTSR